MMRKLSGDRWRQWVGEEKTGRRGEKQQKKKV